MIGLRVGPFEIFEPATVPEPGDWFYARRSGMSQRKPGEVLVRVLAPDASDGSRLDLQRSFDNLRQVEHARVPIAVAMYEGIGAMAITSVRGTPLTAVVAARGTDRMPMSPATLLDLLLEVAEILQYAHHRGRPHGHLEPEHLIIAADGTVWVLGYAAGASAEPDPQWITPERARGEAPTDASDQWSLAALGAALITGKAPWPDDDALGAAKKGSFESMIAPVEQQWPALARLFRKMLDNRPSNRFPTMHQVRQELLALARKAGGTSDRRELAARLNNASALMVTEAGAPVRTTSTPSQDLDPDDQEDTQPVRPVLPVHHPRPDDGDDDDGDADAVDVVAEWEDDDEPEPVPAPTPAPPKPREPSSEPEIQIARTIQGREAPMRTTSTPLPAEQIPVVRPELDGETFGSSDPASDPANYPDPSASFFDDDLASVVDPSSVDDHLNLRTHPDHDPKSVADPPSLPHSQDAADYEATVLFTAAHLEEHGGFAFAEENTGEVEVQVEYTDEVPVPVSPTLSPTTDSDMLSEEIPRPVPNPLPTRPPSDGNKPNDGYMPSRVPDSVGHEPEMGSMHADISIRNEPGFFNDDLDAPAQAELPPPSGNLPQRIAMGAVAVLFLAMFVWAASQLLG